MLPEQQNQSYEKDMCIIAIKDAFVDAERSVTWREVGMLTQCNDVVRSEDRLERSQFYSDDDYGGHVLNVIEKIIGRDPQNELKLIRYILSTLSHAEYHKLARDRMQKIADYLEVIQVIGGDDLSEYPNIEHNVNRIEQSVFEDPEAALGSCKDLVESALKTFLDMPADAPVRQTMPQLIKAARVKLSNDMGNLKHDEDMLKMLSNFGQVLESIATVRNRHGTGHGRGPADTFQLPQPYVVLAANAAISAAVFLTKMRDLKPEATNGGFKAVDSVSEIEVGEDLPW